MRNELNANWPDPGQPGFPMSPERDGWHALDAGKFIHVWHWYAKQKWWERKPNTDIAHEPKHFSHFLYIGPVLTCAQIEQQEETIKALQDDLSAALAQIEELTL